MLKKLNFERYIAFITGFFALTGLYASFILSVERFNILKDSSHQLSCSINSTFNCASVMNSWQAELLGFPNAFFGLIGYAIIATIALHMMIESRQHKYMTVIAMVGSLTAAIFSYWLIFESVFVIKALCIYCLLSCFSATNILIATFLYSIKQNIYKFNEETLRKANHFINKGYYWPIIVVWYFVIFAMVYLEFQSRY